MRQSDTAKWRLLRAKLKRMGASQSHVKVGVFGGMHHSGFTLPEIAAVHEYGSRDGRIPARSFIVSTIREKRPELIRLLGKLATNVLEDVQTPTEALGVLGLWASGAIKKKITSTKIPPPLKPRTVARKGSDRPLVDTGQMLNAITFVVVP